MCKITLRNQILANNIMLCQNLPLTPGAISSLKSSPACTVLLIGAQILILNQDWTGESQRKLHQEGTGRICKLC